MSLKLRVAIQSAVVGESWDLLAADVLQPAEVEEIQTVS